MIIKALVLALMLMFVAEAQSPDVKVYRLSPEESQSYATLQAKKDEAARAWMEANTAQLLLMADAGIPKTERDRKPIIEGDHYAFYPKPSPAPPAKP